MTALRLRAALVSLLAVAAAGLALAQTGAPSATLPLTAAPPAAPAKPMTPAQAARARQEAAKVEQQIAELRRRLHITPAEQPQWAALAQTMRDNANHINELFEGRDAAENMNAVEDLKSHAAIAEAHARDLERLVPAFEALYDVMSSEQKRLADTAFRQFEAHGMYREPHG
jgi:periplasmic protein CpxP/Spy